MFITFDLPLLTNSIFLKSLTTKTKMFQEIKMWKFLTHEVIFLTGK